MTLNSSTKQAIIFVDKEKKEGKERKKKIEFFVAHIISLFC
jgi:uncharacterized protein YdeI (YjbR/CyaY-like superfamily)